MIINHNLVALNAQRQYKAVTNKKTKQTERLSSGYRINRAADDAAGLSISEKMRYQIRGLTQGIENMQDGVSYCKVADGALNELHGMLQRANELAVQAANGTIRSKFGTYQNRLEHSIANAGNVSENTTASESRIRDTNMAEEMQSLSVQNILLQAGEAIMAQANISNQGVLTLLQSL